MNGAPPGFIQDDGTTPVPAGRVRVRGPKGITGTIPAGPATTANPLEAAAGAVNRLAPYRPPGPAMDWPRFGANMIPTVTAGLASMAVPQGAPLWLALAGRTLAGMAGSVPGTLARRPILESMGDQLPPVGQDVGSEAVAQGLGNLTATALGRVQNTAARRTMASSLPLTRATQQQYAATLDKMPTGVAAKTPRSLSTAALKNRMPVGSPEAPKVGAHMEKRMAPLISSRDHYFNLQTQRGVTYTANDPLLQGEINKLIRSSRTGPDATNKVAEIKRLWKDFQDQHRVKGGAFRRLSPSEWDERKQTFQTAATKLYSQEAKGAMPELQAVKAQFADAVGRGIRKSLERNTPQLRTVNAQLAPMLMLRDLGELAEMTPEPRIAPGMQSLWGNVRGLVDTPQSRNMMALRMSGPTANFATQGLPRLAVPGLETMDPGFIRGMFPYDQEQEP